MITIRLRENEPPKVGSRALHLESSRLVEEVDTLNHAEDQVAVDMHER